MMGVLDSDRESVTYSLRGAGEVQRYHTWPTIRRQSVGEHTWQVMRIWLQVFGPMSPEVSTAILLHDAGERVTGDMPFPFKREVPGLKEIMDAAEVAALQRMLGDRWEDISVLTDYERMQLKICDLIEMAEFGSTEVMMGNRYAETIVDCTLQSALEICSSLPDHLSSSVMSYLDSVSGIIVENI